LFFYGPGVTTFTAKIFLAILLFKTGYSIIEYEGRFRKESGKYLERLNEPVKSNIGNALGGLAFEPAQGDIMKLRERNDYRLRAGKYRILYRVEDDTIIVTNIASRGQAYKEV
jgi:mRNA interferase RelE/StbE